MKTNTIENLINQNDVYSFKKFLEKYKNKIYDIISQKFCNDEIYGVYYETLISLWNKEIKLDFSRDILDILQDYVNSVKRVNSYNFFNRRKSFPKLNDSSLSEQVIINRHLLYVNEVILEAILLNNFQSEINANNIKLKKLVPFVKRAVATNGDLYDIEDTWRYRIHLYIITDKEIYVKLLNSRYETYRDEPSYKIYNLSDYIEYKFLEGKNLLEKVNMLSTTGNSNLEELEKPLEITFKDNKSLILIEGKQIESIDLKKYIIELL